MTGAGVGGGYLFGINFASVPAQVANPTNFKVANLIKILGVKGAKAYLYCAFGLGFVASLGFAGAGAYLTADTLIQAKKHFDTRKRRMRDLRIRDLVSDYRERH